jgi:gas vesicle protein
MGEDPQAIRRDIENTRDRMTETVEAIGYRADVKTRAKEAIVDRKDAVVEKASNVVNRVVGAIPDMPSAPDVSMPGMPGFVPDGEQMKAGARHAKDGAKQAVSVAQANPVGLGVGAIAVGFLAGMLVPSTRAEDRRFGELSDQVRDQAREVGQEAIQHGKDVAQDAAHAASQTLQESGQEHGEELSEHLRASAQELGASGV